MSSNEDGQEGITPLQIYALAHLYSEEQKRVLKEQELDKHRRATHHSQSSVRPRPISVTMRELITMIPHSMLPSGIRSKDVYNQLNLLGNSGYLEEQSMYGFHEHASFSITNDGIILLKGVLGQLADVVKDKKEYEKKVETTEGNIEIKKWLGGLWSTLKDKAQEEIADEVLSGVKTYGPQLIAFLVRLVTSPN